MSLPKVRRNWKRIQPRSLRHAMELCIQFAKEKHNLSVERIAERMGLANHWNLYKWMENGRMPAVSIPAFELACGIDFVTRHLAASAHKLLIDMPTGKKADATDINELQGGMTDAIGLLIKFYQGGAEAGETIAAISSSLSEMAWHRENVRKHSEPELSLFDDGVAE